MAKKSFKDNPALQFISAAQPEEPAPARPVESPPEGYKANPLYVEKKTRRLQLVLQPSLYERVKRQAQARGISLNEYVCQALEKAAGKGEKARPD